VARMRLDVGSPPSRTRSLGSQLSAEQLRNDPDPEGASLGDRTPSVVGLLPTTLRLGMSILVLQIRMGRQPGSEKVRFGDLVRPGGMRDR
jgi:hypothetical protein